MDRGWVCAAVSQETPRKRAETTAETEVTRVPGRSIAMRHPGGRTSTCTMRSSTVSKLH